MNRIKQLREEKRMTQIRLGIELEVNQVTISDYILGVSDVRTVMNGISSDSDIEIVSEFNSLTPMEQNMVRAYMQALRDKK